MKFLVTYDETLARTFLVEAETWHEAEDKVLNAVDNGDIVLDYRDFLDSSIMSEEASDDDKNFYKTIEECCLYKREVKPEEISQNQYNALFDMWENHDAPNKTWYINNDGVYTGIDNYDGDFFVESFTSKDDCIKWLEYSDIAADELNSHIR